MTNIASVLKLCIMRTRFSIRTNTTFTGTGLVDCATHRHSCSLRGAVVLPTCIQRAIRSAGSRLLDVLLVDLATDLGDLLLIR